MSDDSDGEGFYDDPFEEASDGDDSCGDPFADEEDDDGCLGLCGGPSDEEGDDDSNGEDMYEVPCCFDDDDDDGSDQEDLCVSPCEDCDDDDDDDGESEEALPDDDDDDDHDGESEEALPEDDDDVEGEELYDEEGNGGEVVDDPCDEDEEEGDGEAHDLCEDPSCNDDEESELVVICVSGFSVAHGSHISDSVQDDSSSEEEDDELVPIALPTRTTPSPWPVRILLHTDSYDDIDSDSDDTDYDVDEYELHRLPASRTVVESLPEATVSEEEAVYGCAVCKDVFPSGQRVVWLPCKHYFHGDCIRPWLAIRSTCPMCRYQLPTDDAESRQARQSSVLVPVALPLARQGEAQQSGGRDGGGTDTVVEPPQAQGMRGTE